MTLASTSLTPMIVQVRFMAVVPGAYRIAPKLRATRPPAQEQWTNVRAR